MVHNRSNSSGTVIGGVFLIGIGILFLLGQFLRFDVWHYLWPLFIIGFGMLFFAGMISGGKSAGPLAIPGSVLTMLGLLFLYQNTFDHWASWAYAWALVAPTGVGIGLIIFGRWSDKPNLYQPGWILMIIGLTIFLVMGAFFELLVGLAGVASPGRILWPIVLIILGVIILFTRGYRWFVPPFSTPPSPASSAQPTAVGPAQAGEAPSESK